MLCGKGYVPSNSKSHCVPEDRRAGGADGGGELRHIFIFEAFNAGNLLGYQLT